MNPPELGIFLWTVTTFAVWGGTAMAVIEACATDTSKKRFLILNWTVALILISLSFVLFIHAYNAFTVWDAKQWRDY